MVATDTTSDAPARQRSFWHEHSLTIVILCGMLLAAVVLIRAVVLRRPVLVVSGHEGCTDRGTQSPKSGNPPRCSVTERYVPERSVVGADAAAG